LQLIGGVGLATSKGRAVWLSLCVLCAAIALLGASLAAGNGYRWAGLAFLLLAFLGWGRSPPANALSAAVGLYCAWLLANAVLVSPAYSADNLYRPLIVLGGFAVAAALDREALLRLFRAGVWLTALLVLFGLLQFFFGFWHLAHNPTRAAATFATPNTFATVINLFLLPLVAFAMTRRGLSPAYFAALWLFAGLLSTESRGGWLACLAGVVVAAAYAGVARRRETWRPMLRMLAGLLAVTFAFTAAARFLQAEQGYGETILARGSSYRLDITKVVLGQIAEHPVAGAGAGMYRILYEMHKPVELDTGTTFPFAHNDYLQIWLEFGLPGLALLCAMVVASAVLLLRTRRATPDDPVPLACAAATAGFFAHAFVDFPLYVSFSLLVIGFWLGALAACAGDDRRLAALTARIGRGTRWLRSPAISGALLTAALAWLAQPVLADYAGYRSLTALREGRAEGGLYWQAVARRLEPRSGAQYWAEGLILRGQAAATRNSTLANLADHAYADGIRADPHYPLNYLERSRLHRTHPDLLARPASMAELLGWSAEAMRLQPYSLAVRAEHARALAFVGRPDEARRIARDMIDRSPESDVARRLARELEV
jgi:O-antigen ligase